MADLVLVKTPSDFKPVFDALKQSQPFIVAIFTGEINESTGESWCSDCVRAKPNIEKHVLANIHGDKVLYCVIDREEWRGVATHPYRVHSKLKVKGVPTVLLIAEGEVMARAEKDEDFDNVELLEMIGKYSE